MEFITLTILRFNSLSKRRDVKKPSWFAVENNILNHPDFFDISGDEFKVYIWVLSVASQRNESTIRVYFDLCSYQSKVKISQVKSAIEKLKGKRWLTADVTPTLRERNVDVSLQDKTRQDKTRQDIAICAEVKSPPRRRHALDMDFFNEIKNIPEELIESWLEMYEESWLSDEIKKAKSWCLANPKKMPKVPGRFLTNWFSRGWEQYRKSIPSNKSKLNLDEVKLSEGKNDRK
jgi:hypothetical protein